MAGSPYQTSCSGAADTNYSITYAPGLVSVGSAPLTITASGDSMTYGGTVPTITPSYSGFVNGDTASSLTVSPTCTTAATELELGRRFAVYVQLQRCGGPQLHHQLHGRVRSRSAKLP